MCAWFSHPLITGNSISNNTAWFGGGIFCEEQSSPTIKNNTINSNTNDKNKNNFTPSQPGFIITSAGKRCPASGGGICCLYDASPSIEENDISDNASIEGGGICCLSGSSIIKGNTISWNTAGEYGCGGGIACDMCSPTIKNNIIANNVSMYIAGGIYCSLASPVIDSCTISNNINDGIYCEWHSFPIINNNNIHGNAPFGVRNVDASAEVDAKNNWWGDPTGPYHPVSNPGGSGDLVSDYVDFDPWLTQPVGVEEDALRPTLDALCMLQVSPNPFSDFTNITFSIGHGAECIELKIYDAAGEMVKDLRPTPYSLRNTLSWDGTDSSNRKLPSGVYFLKLQAGDQIATRKLLLIR